VSGFQVSRGTGGPDT